MGRQNHCKDVQVFLVGPNRFQNELFVSALKEIHDCRNLFVVAESLSDIPSKALNDPGKRNLVYLDCFALEGQEIEALLRSACPKILPDNLLALFNLSENNEFEQTALSYGIRGFFYPDSTPADFCRGTRAILKGEVWLPRKVMSEILLRPSPPAAQPHPAEKNTANLSAREREVLALLDTGATNKAIANELCISVHTVRTHLYHIFKKIKVTNRSQAVLWAEKNL